MKRSKYNLFIPTENEDVHVLFNTLSGETFLVDKITKERIQSNKLNDLDEESFKMYKEKKILIDDNVDELKQFEYNHNKLKFLNNVLHVTVLLTWECNLNCIYCYEGAGKIRRDRLTPEMTDNVIQFIKNQAINRNVRSVHLNLFGGEPLINFDSGRKILQEIKTFCDETNRTFYSGIITNGTLINDEILDTLKENNCKSMQITIDGTKDIHDSRRMFKGGQGSFDIIINKLKLICAKEDYIKPLVRINVDKTNLSTVYDLLDYMVLNGLNDCRIDFGIVRGQTEACSSYSGHCFAEEELGDILHVLWDEAEKRGFQMHLKPAKKWMYCGLYSDAAFSIAPNGDLYKCWEHVGELEHRIAKLAPEGKTTDLGEAYYKWMGRNPLNIDECNKCIYLPSCGGGCGAVSYNYAGTYDAKGCFKVKGVIEEQVLRQYKDKIKELKSV